MRLIRDDRGWIIYVRGNTYADARAKLGDALPKLADVILPANFLARTITSGILSRVRDEPSTPRGNAETTPRSPLQESAHQRAPTRPLAANYGEIAAKFVMCILLEDFAVPPRPLHALTITYESPLPHHSRPTSLSSFLLSNPREITRLHNCIETAFKMQEDSRNPLLKSSYVVKLGRN